MSKEDFIEHQRLRSSSEFEILRTEPKVCRLIKHIHNGTMDEKVYPFVEPPKSAKKDKKEKKAAKGAEKMAIDGENDMLENSRIFVYCIGGLSHHEICSIADLQENLKAQIVPGSNEIITPNTFLKQLEDLHNISLKKLHAENELNTFLGISGNNMEDTRLNSDSESD